MSPDTRKTIKEETSVMSNDCGINYKSENVPRRRECSHKLKLNVRAVACSSKYNTEK